MTGGHVNLNDRLRTAVSYERCGGIDTLRIAAATSVFLQHAITISGLDAHICYGLRISRFGTTAFFAIAGLLAASTRRGPEDWLWQRFRVIYPPFWIALTVYFVIVAITDHKTFDTWQVICQFAGVGHFTHPDRLVNVPTWFLSVILALYLAAYVAKRTLEPAVVLLTLIGVGCVGVQLSGDSLNTACAASVFFMGYTLPFFGARAQICGLLWTVPLIVGACFCSELIHGVIAMLLLSTAVGWRANPAFLQKMAGYTYAWFLMHGLSLHAAKWLIGEHFVLIFPIGGVISIVAAIALREASDRLESWIFLAARRRHAIISEHRPGRLC